MVRDLEATPGDVMTVSVEHAQSNAVYFWVVAIILTCMPRNFFFCKLVYKNSNSTFVVVLGIFFRYNFLRCLGECRSEF